MKRIILISAVLLTGLQIFAQQPDSRINYNEFYHSPINLSLGYQSFSPLSGYDIGAPYNISDLSLGIQYSFRGLPSLQPEILLGYSISDSQNSIDASLWDSNSYSAMAGLRYMHKFSKTFEAGLGVASGMSRTVFTGLTSESHVGSNFILAQSAAYIGINPSYNMNLTLSPSIRYQHSLDDYFSDMNGFLLGIGGMVSFRFGKDPDSRNNIIRSIQFKDAETEPLFAAMQSYYINNSFGRITIENSDKHTITNVSVSFYQPGFMDSPTILDELESLEKDESVTIGLKASFNNEIFMTEGVTPLNGEIKVSYELNKRAVEQTYSISYDLYDKTSIIWDDDRKMAAFITPADSALQNYVSFIKKSCKESEITGLNQKLQTAMQVYLALDEIGCIYQADPLKPFARVSDKEVLSVDTVSLARSTLSKLTGDCDDLTVLYLSLLESLGIETAFLTVPGHIYAAFNTRAESKSYARIHPDRDMTINIDNELWIPVEITLIGRSNFLEAWEKGADQWNSLSDQVESRNMHTTASSRAVFRPVGLKERDLGLQYGNGDMIASAFESDLDRISGIILENYYENARSRKDKRDFNKLGIMLARLDRRIEAENAFNKALKIDDSYLSPRVNIGNLSFSSGDYQQAVDSYLSVLKILEQKSKADSNAAALININLFKSFMALNRREEADHHYELAAAINPEKAAENTYYASIKSEDGLSRASEAGNDDALYMDMED